MATLEVSRFIAAPPQAVWDVIADVPRQGEWMVDVRSLTVRGEQTSGAGTTIDVTSELFGLPLVRDVMEFTAWEPPHRMAVAHRGAFSGDGEFLLEPADNGTIFTWVERFRPPLWKFGEIAFTLAVKPHLTRVFGRSLDNVKRLAEAAAGRGASSDELRVSSSEPR
jgi:hypothetical protein